MRASLPVASAAHVPGAGAAAAGGEAIVHMADVTDEASVETLYREAEAARGPFDIVVANPPFSLEKWGFEGADSDPYARFRRGAPERFDHAALCRADL